MTQKLLTKKNIVIFSDGTGQEGGKGIDTNVYRLFDMLENRTPKQIVYYDSGVGSEKWDIIGKVTGKGFLKNILDCYQFLLDNYQAGDQIYLFGFSRGAATVRSLSGFIHMFGILPKSRSDLIDDAFKIYKISNDKKRLHKATEFVNKNHTMWCRIKFVGVWDTVAALGAPIPFLDYVIDIFPFVKHKFHDFELSKSVRHARHALAVDENRTTFAPVLWETQIDETYQSLKQVWFAGVHTDVGGGYKEHGLSDFALQWMLDEAVAKELRIHKGHKVKISPDANGKLHYHDGWSMSFYRKSPRSWPHGKPDVHKSVIERGQHNSYRPWITQNKQGYNTVS